jgi:hypothetical protein
VELAVAHVDAGVVRVAEADGDDGQHVEEEGGEEQSPEPVLVRAGPGVGVGVKKIGDFNS